MKAGIYFTGTGPILLLTKYDSLTDPAVIERLKAKGINKFIVCEVGENEVKNRYGNHYDIVIQDLKQDDTLRVVDEEGYHVLENFSLNFRQPVVFES